MLLLNALVYYNLYLKSKPNAEEKKQIIFVKSRIVEIN